MSEFRLNVPTAFTDVAQVAEGLADRVDEERIMLYGPDPIPDGSLVEFAILLDDHEPALSGTGTAIASIDGGEERPAVARYDIVLEDLKFEGMSEVVYERMLAARSPEYAASRPTGQVEVNEGELGKDAANAAPAEEAYDADVAMDVDDLGDASAALSASEAPTEMANMADFADDLAEAGPTAEEDADDAESGALAETGEEEAYSEDDHEAGGTEEQAYAEPDSAEAIELGKEEQAAGDYSEDAAHASEAVDEDEDADAAQELAATGGAASNEADEADAHDVTAEWQDASDTETAAIVGEEGIPNSAPLPAAPAEPAPFNVQRMGTNGSSLSRSGVRPSWYPEAVPEPEPEAESGYFAYGGALPIPQVPPRPELDPSLRIAPAPRPGPNTADAGGSEKEDAPAVSDEAASFADTGTTELEDLEEHIESEDGEETSKAHERGYEADEEVAPSAFEDEEEGKVTAEVPVDELEEYESED